MEPSRGAHIREKPDIRFRHGHARFLRGKDHIRAGSQAQASSHGDAVGNNDNRLWVPMDEVIKGILLLEELFRSIEIPLIDPFSQSFDVSASAECPAACATEQNTLAPVCCSGHCQGISNSTNHFEIETVEQMGPVELNRHD